VISPRRPTIFETVPPSPLRPSRHCVATVGGQCCHRRSGHQCRLASCPPQAVGQPHLNITLSRVRYITVDQRVEWVRYARPLVEPRTIREEPMPDREVVLGFAAEIISAHISKDTTQTDQLMTARGIGLRSLHKNIDTTSATGRLILHIFAALGQFEVELLRERTRTALAASRARGRVPRCPRWSEAGAGIAPVGRAVRRPAHHPRGQTPRRRQVAGDPFGCRSSIPRILARTRRHGGRRSGRRWFADRSRREHSPPSSEVSQNSSHPRTIGRVVSGYSSGIVLPSVP
jgi:hypothetical protein